MIYFFYKKTSFFQINALDDKKHFLIIFKMAKKSHFLEKKNIS